MDAQLQQLIALQTEQNQLLKKYLWRIRFSLITLLLLTIAICCCLGFMIYTQRINVSPKSSGGGLSGPVGIKVIPGATLKYDSPRYQAPAFGK
jgi:hypothetical protein